MTTFVERRFGGGAWERVLASLDADAAAEVRLVVPVRWYDLGLQHRVLRAIDETLGEGDGGLVDPIGRFEAEQDLTVVHRVFMRLASPTYILEKSADYWDRFYDTGVWQIERLAPTHARAALVGVAPFDPLFGRYLHAYIARMFELTGARSLQTSYRVEGLSDAPRLVLEGRWR
jgi:hypothetical protein